MKTINIEFAKNTDVGLVFSDNTPLFAELDLYCDLTYDNVKTCSFVGERKSDTVYELTIPRSVTKDLPIGLHKGTLLIKDGTGKVIAPREIYAKVNINRTELA